METFASWVPEDAQLLLIRYAPFYIALIAVVAVMPIAVAAMRFIQRQAWFAVERRRAAAPVTAEQSAYRAGIWHHADSAPEYHLDKLVSQGWPRMAGRIALAGALMFVLALLVSLAPWWLTLAGAVGIIVVAGILHLSGKDEPASQPIPSEGGVTTAETLGLIGIALALAIAFG